MLSWSLDHVGPIAATVSDAVAILDAVAGPDEVDKASDGQAWAPLHTTLDHAHEVTAAGVPRRWVERHCEPGVARCFEATCSELERMGTRLTDIDPPYGEDLLVALRLISIVEANLAHKVRYAERGSAYSQELQTLIELGFYVPATHYLKAQQLRAKLREWLQGTLAGLDLIVSPAMPTIAPFIEQHDTDTKPSVIADVSGIFCSLGALGGLPSCSLPMGLSDNMPCGLLLTAGWGSEPRLLRLAHALERRLGFYSTLAEFPPVQG